VAAEQGKSFEKVVFQSLSVTIVSGRFGNGYQSVWQPHHVMVSYEVMISRSTIA
jgi:hypothetical protein